MKDFETGFILGIILMGLVLLLIFHQKDFEYEQEAIEAGAAYYDSKTAEFKWGKP